MRQQSFILTISVSHLDRAESQLGAVGHLEKGRLFEAVIRHSDSTESSKTLHIFAKSAILSKYFQFKKKIRENS